MATRLYLRNATAAASPSAGDKSARTTLAAASGAPVENRSLSLTKGAAETSNTVGAAVTSGANSNIYIARFSSPALGVTSLSANTWTVGLRADESNTQANMFMSFALYVWNTTGNAVRGFIYDTDSSLGAEVAGTGQVYTFSGSAVSSIAANDYLVLEVWSDQTPGMTSTYTVSAFFDGTTDVIAGTAADAASYLETPQNGIIPVEAYTQSNFRFRTDLGSESAAPWKAAAGTNISNVADDNVRLRFEVSNSGLAPTGGATYQLQYSKNGGTYANVNASSSNVRSSASPNVADGAATTEQLAGAQAFNAGTFDEVDGAATGFNSATAVNQQTELEYCFQVRGADVALGNTLDFRLLRSGVVLDTYSVTPRLTVTAVDTALRVSFPTPSGILTTGGNTQEFRVQVRKTGSGADPSVAVYVRETGGGSNLATVVASTAVSSTTGTVVSGMWNPSVLGTSSGGAVEAYIVGTGAMGGTLEVGAVEWNVLTEPATGPFAKATARASARAALGVSYPLVGRAAGKASDRATLSTAYPLGGRSRGGASTRATLAAGYMLVGTGAGKSSARQAIPALSYPLVGRAQGAAKGRIASPAVGYPLVGRASSRAAVRGATSVSDYPVVGRATGKAWARSNTPAVSYSLAGVAAPHSGAAAQLGAAYPLVGRANGQASVYITTSLTTDVRVGFDTPTSNLVPGPDLQEFRVELRKTAGSGTPTARIELWESGSYITTVLAETDVTDTTSQVLAATWDATLLADITGAGVECRVFGQPDAAGGTAAVEVGAIEWDAYTLSPQVALAGAASTRASARAQMPGVAQPLIGQTRARSLARSNTLGVTYALTGQARGRSPARASVPSITYAFIGQARGRSLARSNTAGIAYPLIATARTSSSGRSSTTVSYVLTGRATSRSSARGITAPPGIVALIGRAGAAARTRAATPALSYALVGRARPIPARAAAVAPAVLYPLVGRGVARSATRAFGGQIVPLLGRSSARSSARAPITLSVSRDITLRWNTLALVSDDLTLRWGVLGAGEIALYPDAILALSGYSGTVDVLRQDPDDVADVSWLTVP